MTTNSNTDRTGRMAGLTSALLLIGFALTFASPLPGDSATALPAGVSQNWWAEAQQQIQNSEYEIHFQEIEGVYQSPNRAQNLRFSYYPEGFSVSSRTGEDSWEIKLTLSAYGREGDVPVAYQGGEFLVAKNQARVSGNGPIAIEYLNNKQGMRQDFIVAERLPGNGQLRLELDVRTEGVSYGAGKEEVSFVRDISGGAEVMRYANLKVMDAEGRELAAHFEKPGDGQLTIVVDDALASYPIIIDPLSTSPAWTSESNQAYAWFGYSVASAGDVNGDGYSDVIVGAPYYDNGQEDEGRVFVYYGSSAGLSNNADWSRENNQACSEYGYSVGTAGDVNGDEFSDIIIGAHYYDNGQEDEGRAYVYHGSTAGLCTTAAWIRESNQAYTLFGQSVASAGDINGDGFSDVIVGAPLYDNGQDEEGRAYVYQGSSAGLCTTAVWTRESNQAYSHFGYSVATAGDVNGDGYSDIVIGIPNYTNDLNEEGRAYVYNGSSAGLCTTASWTAESNQACSGFGISVASAGDVNGDGYSDVMIGASGYTNGEINEGRVFLYQGSSSGLAIEANWIGESDQTSAYYGSSVASAGDINNDGYGDIIVGAYGYDNGQDYEGRAFMYLGSST